MSISDFGASILTTKYIDAANGESGPEDVFSRTAFVLAIPDLFYELLFDKKVIDEKVLRSVLIGARVNKHLIDKLIDLFYLVYNRHYASAKTDKIGLSEFVDDPNKYITYYSGRVEAYYKNMLSCNLLPATPTLLNSGRTGMLSSCFFLRVKDSLDSIFNTLQKSAKILKSGGGIGFDFSLVRPEGSPIKGTNGVAGGPISYMHIYNSMGETINQGGIRKAAMLASIEVSHPDVVKFIKCKEVEGNLSNFNISVMLSDKFMSEANKQTGLPWTCKFGEIDYYIDRETGSSVITKGTKRTDLAKFYSADEILELIAKMGWKNGEPGVIFEEKLNSLNYFIGERGKYGVNPCGEIPLLHGESCNLAAINISNFVHNNEIDYKKLEEAVILGVTLLDNVVSLNKYPLKEIEEATLETRKIGLGTMGLHDMLLKLGLGYGTKSSLKVIKEVYSFINKIAFRTSKELATVRGAIGNFDRRNSHLLAAQPTGTISNIAGCSYGIEPNFKWEYERKSDYGNVIIKHQILDDYKEVPDFAKTAMEIDYREHILVQSEIQEHIDSSISKTINMKESDSVETILNAIKLAYNTSCKSITVYRDKSREVQVLNELGNKKDKKPKDDVKTSPRKRSRILAGVTFRESTPGGEVFITINEDRDGLREVLVHAHKAGSEIGTHMEAEGRLISNSLKYRVPTDSLISHLIGHKSSPVLTGGGIIKSIPDAIAKAMMEYQNDYEGFSIGLFYEDSDDTVNSTPVSVEKDGSLSGELCPQCGEPLCMSSGCEACSVCDYSKCE